MITPQHFTTGMPLELPDPVGMLRSKTLEPSQMVQEETKEPRMKLVDAYPKVYKRNKPQKYLTTYSSEMGDKAEESPDKSNFIEEKIEGNHGKYDLPLLSANE